MKPIAIDFHAPMRERHFWIAMTGLGLIWLVGGGLRVWGASTSVTDVSIQLRAAATGRPVATLAPTAPDIREANSRKIDAVLARDWNKMFAAIENVQLPEARLAAVSMDGESTTVRLEYRLDSLAAVSKLAQELNAGYENPPWLFEGATTSQTTSTRGGPAIGSTLGFHARWSTKLSRL